MEAVIYFSRVLVLVTPTPRTCRAHLEFVRLSGRHGPQSRCHSFIRDVTLESIMVGAP
jgi:hypothetical protein